MLDARPVARGMTEILDMTCFANHDEADGTIWDVILNANLPVGEFPIVNI